MKLKDACSKKKKRCLFLERISMTNLENALKSRDITLPTMVHLVKAKVFPVVMYSCESLTIEELMLSNYGAMVLEKTLESLGLQGDQTSQS